MTSETNNRRSLRAVEGLNFFLADVQTGLGPFLAAYLASSGWNPARVGYALTFGGLATVALQTPAGAVVDAMHRKRLLIAVSVAVLGCGAVLLMLPVSSLSVYSAPRWSASVPRSAIPSVAFSFQRLGYHPSFLGLAAIALAAFLLLWSNLPETLNSASPASRQSPSSSA